MNININSIENSESLYIFLKFMLENGIKFDVWRMELPPKLIGFFQHPKIANLFLDYPITTYDCGVRIYSIFEVLVGSMNDDKLAKWLSNYFAVGNHFYEMFVDGIIFQCLLGAKIQTLQSCFDANLDKYIRKAPQIEAFLTQLHYVENGEIKPCWQPEVMVVLSNNGSPFALYIPTEESNSDYEYIMGYSKVFGKIIHNCNCAYKYGTSNEFNHFISDTPTQDVIIFFSKDLMYQWWETVKNIII